MQDELISTERELWNTAKIYSISHVAEPLVKCRKLINICLFGVEEIGEEYNYSQSVLNQNKIMAINRLLEELRLLISDNKHFLKKKNRDAMETLNSKLDEVESVIDGVSYQSFDQRTGKSGTEIIMEHFNICLKELRFVNSELKKHLGDLIFPSGEEIDLDKLKNEIIEGG